MIRNIVLFLFLQLFSCQLIEGSEQDQTASWANKYFYDDGFQINDFDAAAIIRTRDGGFLAANGGLFLKLNSMGQAQWMKQSYCCWASLLSESFSDGYVSAGTTDYLDESYVRISRIDADGNLIWDKRIRANRFDTAHSLIRTKDGGYLIGAFTASRSSRRDGKAWLIKVTGSGNIQWQKTYNVARPTSLHQLTSGDYLVGTDFFSVLRISPRGDVRWQKKYSGDSCCYNGIMRAVGESGFILAGTRTKNSIDSAVLIKANSAGSIIFSRMYPKQEIEDFKRTSDKGYIILSRGHYPSKTFVTKLDMNGIITWRRASKKGEFLTPRNILQAKDGGYLITEGSESWIIKLNQFGNTPNACRSIFTPNFLQVENINIAVESRFPTVNQTQAIAVPEGFQALDATPIIEPICSP